MPEELKKILYVEDDEDIAEVTVMTLADIGGFEVKHCFSGKLALEILPEYKPQLVLMDVMMPEMDGTETVKAIRKMPEWKNIPIIFMTAKIQHNEQREYLRLGAIGVIVKPFDSMALCENIRNRANI